MERITVVKIGGNVIDNPAAMKRFLKEFAALEGPKILVHGGGKLATRLAERLELKVQMVDGRRITDKGIIGYEHIHIIEFSSFGFMDG